MLEAWLVTNIYGLFLIFARLGTALMVTPGFAESYVSARIRLTLALVMSLMILPMVQPLLPPQPDSVAGLARLIFFEVTVGLFLGTLVRFLLTALSIAGQIVALLTGMMNAMVFDAITAQQAALPGTLFSTIGLVLIFATDLHHLVLTAYIESYTFFSPGVIPPPGDMADTLARSISDGFVFAIHFSGPFVVIQMMVLIGMGLLARLAPTIQVFFLMLPLQISIGLLVMVLVVPAGMLAFLNYFEGHVMALLGI